MAEVHQAIVELTSEIPDEVHWFCPKEGPDDGTLYFEEEILSNPSDDEDGDKEQRETRVAIFEARKTKLFSALQIFAYGDSPDALKLQKAITSQIKSQLERCHICIREYHKIRVELRDVLAGEYEPDEVALFLQKFDAFNNDRLKNNLDHAANQLERLPPKDRKISRLDLAASLAFFEAVSSTVFARNESLLSAHFDKPFQLIQGAKRLKLAMYLPAATSFLFSSDPYRRQWAEATWKLMTRKPTRKEFDWTIRDPLLAAMSRVQMTSMDLDFLPIFWKGMRTILSRLDEDLITHSIRGMDLDVFMLSLEHLHIKSKCFPDLITSFELFLKIAPKAYWDSMGTINPPTVIEQVFQSPSILPILQDSENTANLVQAFSWTDPFLESISAANQPTACRSLVQHFMEFRQNQKLAMPTREYCFNLAVSSLNETMQILAKNTLIVDPACIGEVLNVFDTYSFEILSLAKAIRNPTSTDAPLVLHVVQHAIELDTLNLLTGYESITRNKPLSSHHFNVSGALWKNLLLSTKTGGMALTSFALNGAQRVAFMEKFFSKSGAPLPKDSQAFNNAFDATCCNITQLLERADSFSARDLAGFFKSKESASGIVSTLFYAESSTRAAAGDILKTLSVEDGRREALGSIIDSAYGPTMSALAEVVQSVQLKKVFTPLSAMVRVCTDVLDVLCSSRDGLLRARDLTSEECEATLSLWQSLWQALMTIFDNTERWALMGHNKIELMEFCRDVMQFAYDLFEHHSVLVSSLVEVDADAKEKMVITKRLLKYPNGTMKSMVKYLRLRDEFLASKIVQLVSELLIKLHDASMEISEAAASYLEDIFSGVVKVKLTPAQMASLSQALDTHMDIPAAEKPSKIKSEAKTAKQTSLNAWMSTGSRKTEDDDMAKLIKESSAGAEAYKAVIAKRPTTPSVPIMKRQQIKTGPVTNEGFMRKRAAEIEAARQRKAAAIEKSKKLRGELGEAGSGLDSLRTIGKDHAAKGTGMMVSSDESEESDDEYDEIDRELFPSNKSAHRPRPAHGDLVLQHIKETPRGPLRIKRTVRSVKDMRARLAPDLSSLHKTILSWEYFHPSDYPPGSSTDIYQKVPATFRAPHEYKNVFEPLLILEAWQGFVKAREEGNFKSYAIKISNRANVDAFLEVSSVMPQTENREVQVSEGDVVLCSRSESPATAVHDAHCLARVHKVSRKKGNLEILYRILPGNDLTRWLAPDAVIWGVKVQSLTPLEREYGALQSLQYYDLCDYILRAQPSHLLEYNDKQLTPIINNYQLNKAQAKAVKSAIDNDAFTLIQGPPGSGKTKTIVAIVGALLTENLKDKGTVIARPYVPGGPTQQLSTSKKLLVCAPSNAAVDELVMRFKTGVRTVTGELRNINVVRLGRSDAINANVQDVTLEELVNARLNAASGQNEKQRLEIGALMKEHQGISAMLRTAREALDNKETKETKEEFERLRRRKTQLSNQIDNARDQEKNMVRQVDLERKKAQQMVLDQAHVICATLSGSGHDMFQNLNIEFETVVVDEAAQCVEASALIPLKYGCAKCILVGDPKQLPPTVFSKEAARFQYEQSLFVRLQTNCPKDVHLLDTQYRMHPEISLFPSVTFYDGRLLDGPNMGPLRERPWHSAPLLGPYRFFDVQGQHQSAPKGHSLINLAEIEVALQLYERLTNDYAAEFDFKANIGIITPYKSQLVALKQRFTGQYGQMISDTVEFNTTDAFQGRECDIIIFSCVRASPAGNIGFLRDIRRMNVGLTRAKSSLWVLGNSDSLMRGEFWGKLIEDSKARDRFSRGNYMQELQRPYQQGSRKAPLPMAPTAKSSIREEPLIQGKKRKASTDIIMIDSPDFSTKQHKPEPKPQLLGDRSLSISKQTTPSSTPSHGQSDEEQKDVEMEDVSMVKDEEKAEPATSKPAPKAAKSAPSRPAIFGGRPPAVPVIRKVKRAPANPLVQPNRPKKPKPQ